MSVVVWIGMVLTLLGIQNAVIAWMDSVSFGVGNAHMTLLAQAAADVPRVLREPAPTPFLVGFGRDGINLELGFRIEDAASGTRGVLSTVNCNIWRLFSEHGITIALPQREVRIVGQASGAMPHPVAMTDPDSDTTPIRRSGPPTVPPTTAVKPRFAPRQGMRQCPGNRYRLDSAQKIPICYKHLEPFK
ncbi:hypothetical protein SAMN05445850_0801 [Paraburkholderia tuberum]|uniref:Mechanosensitive ion channel MscS C-terminal domain-containing protein n=1 Tax=Paraburkholderia tuberum TaxID=157910 RepID=A0A1H1BBW9_9BURK|nr:hypothetical protein SAMN05445850_0801 [Paraburkholderia tuberum]